MAVTDHSPEAVESRAADVQRSRDTAASLNDSELFRSAMAPPEAPKPAEQPAATQPEPTSEQPPPAQADTRPRDEQGRFVKQDKPTEQTTDAPAAATQQPSAQPAPAQEEALIPSWRLREVNEQRQAEANARMRLEAELAEARRIQAQWQQRVEQQQQPAPEVPDLYTDPAGFQAHLMRLVQEQVRDTKANVSFQMTHERYGDDFLRAYNAMLEMAQRGDPSVVQHVMANGNPGASLMNWYRSAVTSMTLGEHDPNTWAEKVWMEEKLKDEAWKASMREKLGVAPAPTAQQGNGQAAPVATYQVPPSLSRVPGSAASGSGGDMSDPSLFAFAMRGGR